jgi:hypothetical protein
VAVKRHIVAAARELLPFGRLWLLVLLLAAWGVTVLGGGGWGSGTFAIAIMVATLSFLAITLLAAAAWDLRRWVSERRAKRRAELPAPWQAPR